MDDDLFKTIRIQRDAKVGTDSKGRTVWTKPIAPAELELVSTMMLEQLLETNDEQEKARIRELAQSEEGVLARDTQSKAFAIVSDDELEAALRAANAGTDSLAGLAHESVEASDDEPSQELSLVTTQVLRRMLAGDKEAGAADELGLDEDEGGYNPYDKG